MLEIWGAPSELLPGLLAVLRNTVAWAVLVVLALRGPSFRSYLIQACLVSLALVGYQLAFLVPKELLDPVVVVVAGVVHTVGVLMIAVAIWTLRITGIMLWRRFGRSSEGGA